ncbi:hypothetical protein GGF43_001201 [Coemansia sp. RSA 2618]|nr:hypothetical protein GGF43_001201 [Coemansia sp. RSA 2618]
MARVLPQRPAASVCVYRHRCSVQQRWVSDKPERQQQAEKQAENPTAKNPHNEDKESEQLREWDRTIDEAIEQAKRELTEQQAKPSTSKQQQQQPQNEQPSDKQPSDKHPKAEEPKDGDDYITTLGQVMIELPHQVEGFFAHGLDPHVYSPDVRFAEPRHSGIHLSGRHQYLGVARVLRIAMNAYFASPHITITRMRQVTGKADDVSRVEVYVRWVFEGVARHSELIGGEGSRYEGEFRYEMDPRTGRVAVHEVTAVHPTPPTMFLATSGLARWAGWLSPRGSLSLSRRCP